MSEALIATGTLSGFHNFAGKLKIRTDEYSDIKRRSKVSIIAAIKHRSHREGISARYSFPLNKCIIRHAVGGAE